MMNEPSACAVDPIPYHKITAEDIEKAIEVINSIHPKREDPKFDGIEYIKLKLFSNAFRRTNDGNE